jgi:hypothetical protein
MMALNQRVMGPIGRILAVCRRKDKADTALKATFLVMQMADLILTLVAARSGWIELNPLMRAQLDSIAVMALVKFLIPGLVSWFVPGRLLIPAILLLCGVVGWNLREMIVLAMI